MRILALFCVFFGSFVFNPVLADTLRIGAWNIQDLHHETGHHLREFSGGFQTVKRKQADFDMLLKYSNLFGRDGAPADVLALQEIGTKAALDKIFPSSDYATLISSRWKSDDAEPGEGDVYTAIAVRKESGISIVKQEDLADLAVLHSDGRPTRGGTAALLDYKGQQFWFLSLHLKSSCSNVKNAHKSSVDDCETLWKQIPILKEWIAERRAENIPFIIAGDLNRRFRQFQNNGPIWKALNDVEPDDDLLNEKLSQHPEKTTRKCPTRKGSSTQPIDWILLDASIAHWFEEDSYWERRWKPTDIAASQNGRGLSDHCPISIDVNLN